MINAAHSAGRRKESMKYLLLFSAKPGPPPPSETFVKHKEWVLELVKKGVIEVAYTFAASSGGIGMCIANVASPEDLNDFKAAAPLGPFTDVELRVLTDFEKQMDRTAAALKRAT
jgi:hypothetical protein